MVIRSLTPWLRTYMGQSLIRCNTKLGTPEAVHVTSSEADAGGFALGAALSSLRERVSIGDSMVSELRQNGGY